MNLRRGRTRNAGNTLAALGLLGVLINLVVVYTTLTGLRQVDRSYDRIATSTTAQRYFQDADQAHDTLRGDVLEAVSTGSLRSPGSVAETAADALKFRVNLQRVRSALLSPEVRDLLTRVAPLQESYVAQAERIAQQSERDVVGARAAVAPFLRDFRLLDTQQNAITVQLAADSSRAHARATTEEHRIQARIIGASLLASFGFLLLTYMLWRLGRAYSRMISQQRDAAETLQHGLLPDRLPKVVGVELAARYRPAGRGAEVGGDWYDVISLPGGQVGLVMGDVVGHDFRAASMMGQFRNALRAYAAEGLPPADVLGRLNTFAHQQDIGEMATVVYAVLDPVACTFSVSSAGHQPPLICTGTTAWFLSVPTRPPIGAVRETRFGEVTRTLEPEDVVLLYTDGLVERKWESIDVGLERLLGSARASGDLDELCERILSTLLEDDPHDDVALLAVAAASTLGDRFEMDFPAEAPSLLKLRRALTRWLNEVGATAEESYEILVSVSEAATNAVEHAYGPGPATFHVGCRFEDSTVGVVVRDWGQWREPRGLDRGRGQILMEGLMDSVRRRSADGGTEVVLCRRLREARGDKSRTPELEVHG
ncbi:MAG: hypothetical protein QOC98_2205 [Frankiaceae bacterium]|nr:hypothetical protein [Frankiaceae bacterium]